MSNDRVNSENFGYRKHSSNLSMFPETIEYANAYVPFQITDTMFNLKDSLCKGTVFPDLYQPYTKRRCGCE